MMEVAMMRRVVLLFLLACTAVGPARGIAAPGPSPATGLVLQRVAHGLDQPLYVTARADLASAHPILKIGQPFANHNGGLVMFGPDGMLNVGMGDGGAGGDPFGNGQKRGTLLGKLLRLDVDHGDPYVVPRDNPFAGRPGKRGEIWAYGLRNPWRFCFDRAAGLLVIADVGQDRWEEVDV